MISFHLTYNYSDLRDNSEELLTEFSVAAELVSATPENSSRQAFITDDLFYLYPPVVEGTGEKKVAARKARLVFHPARLAKALAEEKFEWPQRVFFQLIVSVEGKETAYRACVEYLGKSKGFYDPYLTWNWAKERQLNLSQRASSGYSSLGTLRIDKLSTRVYDVAFQIHQEVEHSTDIFHYPLKTSLSLNGTRYPDGIEKIGDSGFRFEFRGLSASENYNLRIHSNWLEDNRITKLSVWWEGDFEQWQEFGVVLPELGAAPLIEIVGFDPAGTVKQAGSTYVVDYKEGRVDFGKLKVRVTDPRGKGYTVGGSINTGKEQGKIPLNLPPAGLPPGVSRGRTERRPGTSQSSVAFQLKPDKAVEEFVERPYFKTYLYEIPLLLATDKVAFTNVSPDAVFAVEVSFGEEHDRVTESLELKVTGSSETALQIIPKQLPKPEIEDFPVNLKVDQPKVQLPRFTIANARTQRGGSYISFRLENIALTSTNPGKSDLWKLVLSDGEKNISINDTGNTPVIATLGDKAKVSLHFELLASDGFTTRSAPEEMALRFEIVYCIHQEADPLNRIDPDTLKRVDRHYLFSVAPVINRNYISIDLGTSAIVAAHSSSSKDGFDFDFIDLQQQLELIRKRTGAGYNAEVQQEGSTRFVSSNILLRDKYGATDANPQGHTVEVKPSDPSRSLVELAPPPVSLAQNHQRWLPNIKMLFGGSGVSKLKNAFASDLRVKVEDNVIKTVDWGSQEVIELSMHALVHSVLNDYVLPEALKHQEEDNLTEIVFTVPNNFSEEYRIDISSWAEVERSAKHPGITVSFVSESDAIAYAYLDQGEKVDKKSLLEEPEIILAYDIGAGTVDLSLIERSVNPTNNSESILNVIGRVGLPKAGNYLDYVIAKVVWELYGIGSENEMIGIPDPFEQRSSEAREFHNFIRNELKPEIGKLEAGGKSKNRIYTVKNNTSLFPIESKQTMSLHSIINHPDFECYLKEVASTALDKLFYNAYGEEHYAAVDTVIFSGRTSQMHCIKNNLRNALGNLPGQDIEKVAEVNLGEWSMSNLKADQEKLKGIVALGGLRYLKKYRTLHKKAGVNSLRLGTRHIMSSYGILYNRSSTREDDWQYLELVHPQGSDGDEFFYEKEVDFGGATKLFVIQTFDQNLDNILQGFDNGKFLGDYTVGLDGGRPIVFHEEGFVADDIDLVSVSVRENRSLRLKLHWKRQYDRTIQKDFIKYQVGYNIHSPALLHSLWPFIDAKK